MAFKEGDFAKGLQDFFTAGALVAKTRFTKQGARILLDQIYEWRSEITTRFPEEGSPTEYDYCEALQWMVDLISRKWAMRELYGEDARAGNFAESVKDFDRKGALVMGVTLRRRMGAIIMMLINEERHITKNDKEYYAAAQYVINIISKKWSYASLGNEDNK